MKSQEPTYEPYDDDDEEEPSFLKTLAKYLFSHVGLLLLVIGYVVGGAFLFIELEGEPVAVREARARQRSHEMETLRANLVVDLWNHKWSSVYNVTLNDLLDRYQRNVSDAIKKYDYRGVPRLANDTDDSWGVASAVLFTVSVVTTIGYGHVYPVTEMGQLVLIVYALIGIPLMLMFLANIGDWMAKFFRTAYNRGCCFCCHRRRETERDKYREARDNKRANEIGDANRQHAAPAWEEGGVDKHGRQLRRDGSVRSRGNRRDSGIEEERDSGSPRVVEEDDVADYTIVDDELISVPISLTLVVIAAYVFIGAILFATWNGWSWVTGAYFSFVTLSTIGFGDLVPGLDEAATTEGKLKLCVAALYIVFGLAVLSMAFNLMMEEMIEKFRWFGRKIGLIDDPKAVKAGDKRPLFHDDDPQSVGPPSFVNDDKRLEQGVF